MFSKFGTVLNNLPHTTPRPFQPFLCQLRLASFGLTLIGRGIFIFLP